MSLSQDILDYLVAQPKESLARLDPATIGQAIQQHPWKVTKLLGSLEATGRIKLRRDGRNIVGIDELTRPERKTTRAPRGSSGVVRLLPSNGTPVRNISETRARYGYDVKTPALDAYRREKEVAAQLQSAASRFVTVDLSNNVDPVAEEGLALIDTLARLRQQYDELSTQYKLNLRELTGMRERIRERVTESVAKDIMDRALDH